MKHLYAPNLGIRSAHAAVEQSATIIVKKQVGWEMQRRVPAGILAQRAIDEARKDALRAYRG